MASYLIRINKRGWDIDPSAYPWLKPGEIAADVHQDVRVRQNAVSVWHIDDDRSNLDQVIIAIASTRDACDTFDYGLFNIEIVSECGIKVVPTESDTPLSSANHWHRDLSELTVEKLRLFINNIFGVLEKGRLSKGEIRSKIITAVQERQIEMTKLKPAMQDQINKRTSGS